MRHPLIRHRVKKALLVVFVVVNTAFDAIFNLILAIVASTLEVSCTGGSLPGSFPSQGR